MHPPDLIYRINASDELVFVNDAWNVFAIENGAADLASPDILNRSLWTFITDETTRFVYTEIVNRTRAGHEVKFEYRCDSPELRRHLEMLVSPVSDGGIQFDSRTLSVEKRESVLHWDRPTSSNKLLHVCSWRNRINIAEKWREVDEAVHHPDLFKSGIMPMISHGMCEECYERMVEKIPVRTSANLPRPIASY